jgi:hypothetical protein
MFAPRTIRVTQTKPISITITKYTLSHSDLLPGGSSSVMSDQSPQVDNRVAKSYTVELRVIDDAGVVCAEPKEKKFGDEPLTLDTLYWQCTIHPKQAGDYSILVSGLPKKDVGTITVADLSVDAAQPHEYQQLADGTLSIPVTALTVQGATAGQWAWLQAIGTLLGVFGTVLGYPFLKSRFERTAALNSSIKDELKTVIENTTSLYNELVDVFSPYLHPESLDTRSRDEQREAAEQFAFRRDYRDKIEKACGALGASSKGVAHAARSRIKEADEAARWFLQVVSGLPDPCFLAALKETVLPPDLPDRVKAWLEQSRVAHDAVARSVGESLATIG